MTTTAPRALLAPGFRGWGNLHGEEMDADDVRRMVTGDGFVEQRRVRAPT